MTKGKIEFNNGSYGVITNISSYDEDREDGRLLFAYTYYEVDAIGEIVDYDDIWEEVDNEHPSRFEVDDAFVAEHAERIANYVQPRPPHSWSF